MEQNSEIAWKRVLTGGRIDRRSSIQILCFLILLYMPVQWITGRHPGSTSIFSSQHQDLRRDFFEAAAALRDQLTAACRQENVHEVYLSDSDVLSPYVVNQTERVANCQLRRATDVTPVEPESEIGCSKLIVDEYLPNPWNPVRTGGEPSALDAHVRTVNTWQSHTGAFGFRLLQSRDCTDRFPIQAGVR